MWKFDPDDYIKRVLGPALRDFNETGQLPDIFARFDLPLGVADQADIEKAFQTVSSSWSKTKQNIKYTRLLSVLSSDKELKESRRVLLDLKARNESRQIAERERQKRSETRFEALDRSIALSAAKGFITSQERAALISHYHTQGLTEAEVVQRLGPIRVQEFRMERPREGLPRDVRRRIREDLRVLKRRDLYEFLSAAPGCTKAQLIAHYQKTEREWRPRPNDHVRTSANSLLGIVKVYLIDGDPENYEHARRFELLEQMRPDIQLAGADKRINQHEFREFVKMAAANGLDAATATDFILSVAADMGISVEWTTTDDTIACPNCWTSVPIKNATDRCVVCGHALWKDCPKCRSRLPAKLEACGKCGFVVSELPRVRLLIRTAELALDDGQYADALESARKAEAIWGREGDVVALFQRIETQRKKLEAIREEVAKCLADRRLSAARAALASLQSEAPEYQFRDGRNVKEIAAQIEAQAKRVGEILDKARRCEQLRQFNEAVLAYDQALSLAQDCDEARKGLERCPPEPPGKPQTIMSGDSIQVEWTRSLAVGAIEYVVVRRPKRAPASLQDGVLVARTSALSCRDDKVAPGVLFFYSVFAERAGVRSTPACSSGLLTAVEVFALTLVGGSGIVTGSWEPAAAGARVRITRKEGSAPAQPGDGIEILPSGPQGFADTTVLNGVHYYYRVFVEYHHPAGRVVITPGQIASARPDELPVPVTDLHLTRSSRGVGLAWSPPPRGSVQIYRITDPPKICSGSPTATSQLIGWGAPLRNTSPGEALDPSPSDKAVYYVPSTFLADLAVVGAHRKYVPLEDVSGIEAQDFGDYVQLRWRWPDDCVSALVVWRTDSYPEDPQEQGVTLRTISRGEYHLRGGCRINDPDSGPYKIVVFASSRVDGEELFSPGLDPGCRVELRTQPAAQLTYTLERSLFRSAVTITLRAAGQIASLPEFVVVGRSGEIQPTKLEDGEVLLTLGGLSIPAGGELSRQFRLPRKPIYVRAFFRDPSAYAGFHLIDPPATQMKIK